VAPRDGLNVVLTIDAGLQNIVEANWRKGVKAFPISISCIMVRPRTGEILAMATLPNFDPNHPGPFCRWRTLRNRVISDEAEPGSTFKIVVVTGGLNEHLITLNDVFDCGMGQFFLRGPHGCTITSPTAADGGTHHHQVLQHRRGQDRHSLGKERSGNTSTTLDLASARASRCRLKYRALSIPLTNWTKVSIAQIPMGQGVAVTSCKWSWPCPPLPITGS
jgi:cell division protein FtsI/penicillin-binding protein 2